MEDLWGGFHPYKKTYPKGVYRVRDPVPVVYVLKEVKMDRFINHFCTLHFVRYKSDTQ